MDGGVGAMSDSIRANEKRIERAASEGRRQVALVSPVYFGSEVASHFRKLGFAVYKKDRRHYVRW